MNGHAGPVRTIPYTPGGAPSLGLCASTGDDQKKRIDCRRIVTILGSKPGCKIALSHRSVSPVHVALVNNGMDVLAIDLASANGTLLNALPLKLERLQDGDRLHVGPFRFEVRVKAPASDDSAALHLADLEPHPRGVALEQISTGKLFKPQRDICLIGRAAECDISIQDSKVSRAHALIFSFVGRPAVVDLNSQNETRVNDQPVAYHELLDGDVITLGDSSFRARILPGHISPNSLPQRDIGEEPTSQTPDDTPDLIDIQAAEGASKWPIVDSWRKATGENG